MHISCAIGHVHGSIETDMIPIGDGNQLIVGEASDIQRIETDMIPIGDGN